MSEHEGMLIQLGSLLSKVARPHRCDDRLPEDVQAGLWELGVQCGDETSREELITRLWARKRSLLLMVQPEWGGPGVTPPSAA
jgi:hypothetical protein